MNNVESNAIVIQNLIKRYGSKTILNNVSLQIPKGIVFGLLGPNGAGKSSMINIISGIIKQTEGDVFIMNKNIKTHPNECKILIGTAIQEVLLDPFFSVKDYLTFMAGYYGIPKNKAKERIEEVCTHLDLIPHLHKNTRMLSGGMKKRLIIAKAILHNPEIIILDEPTAGVDIELRSSLWSYILKLQKQGKTIILTTHYLEEAESFCDRIAFINEGKIILNDTKKNILNILQSKTLSIIVNSIKSFEEPKNCNISLDEKLNTILVNYNPANFDISNLIQTIQESKMIITDIISKQSNLDDVFLSIFKHKSYE
jgi:ABC-2 type transport system ATP-binding protein